MRIPRRSLRLALLTLSLLNVRSLAGQQAGGQQNSQFITTTRFPPQSIVGFVYDIESGAEITHAQIIVEGMPGGALSDSLGNFRLRAPRDGRVVLQIIRIMYETIKLEINVEPGRATMLAVGIKEYRIPMDHPPPRPPSCTTPVDDVLVRDVLTRSAPNVQITLRVQGQHAADSMTVRAEADSRVVQVPVPALRRDPGPYAVEVRAAGYAPWTRTNLGLRECTMVRPFRYPVWLLPLDPDTGARE